MVFIAIEKYILKLEQMISDRKKNDDNINQFQLLSNYVKKHGDSPRKLIQNEEQDEENDVEICLTDDDDDCIAIESDCSSGNGLISARHNDVVRHGLSFRFAGDRDVRKTKARPHAKKKVKNDRSLKTYNLRNLPAKQTITITDDSESSNDTIVPEVSLRESHSHSDYLSYLIV
jgi:hypothetical protein